MAKKQNGEYRTISVVVEELKTSVKTIKKLVQNGELPAPEIIPNGGAPFRHFNADFMAAARVLFEARAEAARAKAKPVVSNEPVVPNE